MSTFMKVINLIGIFSLCLICYIAVHESSHYQINQLYGYDSELVFRAPMGVGIDTTNPAGEDVPLDPDWYIAQSNAEAIGYHMVVPVMLMVIGITFIYFMDERKSKKE